MYSEGSSTSVTAVAKSTPDASATAIGIRNCACRLDSSMSGVTPAAVVSDVRMIGRKRASPANCTARGRLAVLREYAWMNEANTSPSLTTMPASATIPQIDRKLTCSPSSQCPQIAPTMPKGTELRMMNGRI